MLQWLIFVVVGILGGLIMLKLRIPAGTLIGSMIFIGAFKYFNLIDLTSNSYLSFAVQMLLGAVLGFSLSELDIKKMKELSNLLIIVFISIFIMTFLTGYLLGSFTDIGYPTFFLASAPGGIAEMSIVAKSVNLDSSVVALMHILRLIIVLILFPIIIKIVNSNFDTSE